MSTLISAIGTLLLAIIKGIFGTDKPQKNTISRPEPEIEITDGKTDEERLKDFGL